MRIRFLFFALYREFTGADELELEVPAGSTARDAVARLRAAGNGFSRLPERPVIALNREYAKLDRILSDGDELALVPPVAGG
jgi:molybdopterin synthase catalytic subunit